MGSNKRAGSASKVRIDKFEDLFGGSAEQESSAEQIINAPLTDLHTFKDHPFRVEDDEKMEETTESIRQYGVLVPGIATSSSLWRNALMDFNWINVGNLVVIMCLIAINVIAVRKKVSESFCSKYPVINIFEQIGRYTACK